MKPVLYTKTPKPKLSKYHSPLYNGKIKAEDNEIICTGCKAAHKENQFHGLIKLYSTIS